MAAAILSTTVLGQTKTESHFWQGFLKLNEKDSLRITLLLEFQDDSLTKVEMDSPDQFAFEIPATKYEMTKDSLFFEVKSINASYKAKSVNEDYDGIFTQRGKTMPLFLKKTNIFQRFPPRPQTPKKPYQFLEEEMEIEGAVNPKIKGTLAMPTQGAVKGLVIMVTGSGWQDRDQTIFGHKTFLVITDYLTRNGWATFRYDDAPIALFQQMTTFDFEKDLHEIVNHFNSDERLGGAPIGLLGHSEGGTVVCMTAANCEAQDVDFVVSLAGAAVDFSEILIYQSLQLSAESGYSQEIIEKTEKVSRKIYKAIAKGKNPKHAQDNFIKAAKKEQKKVSEEEAKMIGISPIDIYTKARSISPWFYNIFQIDMQKSIKHLVCPVFAANGEKDMQVNARDNLDAFQNNLPYHELHLIKSYPELNHLFQNANTGSVREYKDIDETISEEFLHDLLNWLNKVANGYNE